jgi:hypothetical protein
MEVIENKISAIRGGCEAALRRTPSLTRLLVINQPNG